MLPTNPKQKLVFHRNGYFEKSFDLKKEKDKKEFTEFYDNTIHDWYENILCLYKNSITMNTHGIIGLPCCYIDI
jgi:hypothetical protein